MAAESKLQKKIRLDLEKQGWFVLKIMLCNKNGFPDLVLFKSHRQIFFIEAKSKNKITADPLQDYRHEVLKKMGFKVFVTGSYEQYLEIKKKL